MHKDFENSVESPLREKNDLEYFFTGGDRGVVLARLQESVTASVPLLVLTGEEGSGKTMLCRMLEQRVPEECVVIYFQHTVESFEDVVRIIARQLGVAPAATMDGKGGRDTIEKIVKLLLENHCHLLIIFDEAENIYLATLERVRKMLGQMTEAGVYLHVLFSGRPAFLGNYEQLIICDFKPVEEIHLSLELLSDTETVDYLERCIDRLPGDIQRDVFTDEVIVKICGIAKGNFQMINTLVEESIVTPGDDSSFMVLLDSVADAKEGDTGLKWIQAITDIKRFIPMISWTGGAVAVVVVLFLVFGSGDEENRETLVLAKKMDEKKQGIIIAKERVVIPESVDKDTVAPVDKVVEQAVVVSVVSGEAERISSIESDVQSEVTKTEDKKTEIEVVKEPVTDNEKVEETTIASEEQTEIVRKEVKAEPLPQEDVIIELRQSSSLKKKVGVLQSTRKRKLTAQVNTGGQKKSSTNAHLTVNQLYAKRVAAGKEWERGARDSMYTIQLMALTSKNAEQNLKQMLGQENYRQQAGNFFIFKKNSSPAALLVYYGEYSSMAKARRTQKTIPTFLLKHKPYPLSIKGAVAKIKK